MKGGWPSALTMLAMACHRCFKRIPASINHTSGRSFTPSPIWSTFTPSPIWSTEMGVLYVLCRVFPSTSRTWICAGGQDKKGKHGKTREFGCSFRWINQEKSEKNEEIPISSAFSKSFSKASSSDHRTISCSIWDHTNTYTHTSAHATCLKNLAFPS